MAKTGSSLPEGISLAGKTLIVTGGNTGLGFEFARQALLLHASRVIITARSQVRGQTALATLQANTEIQNVNPNCRIELFDLDLDDYQSGLRFCQRVKEQVPELDVLLCNGGTTSYDYELSKSGHERIMQVNCYTHFFIIFELLDLLRATSAKRGSPSRVTLLGSFNHDLHDLERVPIPPGITVLDYFDSEKLTRGSKRYNNSKLAVIALTQKLATLVPASEVIVNTVCPGVVMTKIGSRLPVWIKPIAWAYMKPKAVSLEKGGQRIMHAAVKVNSDSHGKFMPMGGQLTGHTLFLDKEAGKKFKELLWSELLAEAKKLDPALKVFS